LASIKIILGDAGKPFRALDGAHVDVDEGVDHRGALAQRDAPLGRKLEHVSVLPSSVPVGRVERGPNYPACPGL
jgi:hypothetical protein